MRKGLLILAIFAFLLSVLACENDDSNIPENVLKNRELSITSNLLSSSFVGNGAQWGGYDMVPTWLDTETLSDADWNTLFSRIDYMRPPFLRIMTTAEWSYDDGGDYNETKKTLSLFKMLDYAQSRNIEITYGEWGHHDTDGNISNINTEWIANSVKFLNHLVNEKGYACIKTINII
ncbi:MAG: hypothetical protein MI866_10395, partial [Bacteroidales bacterium]|nr:hypothetical protein [Bacteroidales bacterium]